MTLTNIEDRTDTRPWSAPTRGDQDAAFDELAALAAAGDRWLAGRADVENATRALAPVLSPASGQRSYSTGVLKLDRLTMVGDREVRYSEYGTTEGFLADFSEGKSFRFSASPGTVSVSQYDPNKKEKTGERATEAHVELIRLAGSWIDAETGEIDPDAVLDDGPPAASIWRWSSRSRMRMVRAVAELDYSDWTSAAGDLAMVTLTLPGDWLAVAPDGKSFKAYVNKFRLRWRRAIGEWRCLWKLEFQKRGAPHMHLLLRVPAMVGDTKFQDWLSQSWADCVKASTVFDRVIDGEPSSEYTRHVGSGTGVDFSGKKFSDPRRIALYFLGHSMKGPDGKEYQHIVPEAWRDHTNTCEAGCDVHGGPDKGPGRFWGFAGFQRAVVELEITHADFAFIARQLRKLQRARDWKSTLVQRRGRAKDSGREVSAVTHRWSKYNKKTRAMGAGGSILGGWVLLNDALPVVQNLGRCLADPVNGPGEYSWVGVLQPSWSGDLHRDKREALGAGPGGNSFSFPLPAQQRTCCRYCDLRPSS